MPYLRVYSRHLSIEQKRIVSEKLFEITLRALHLRAADRYRTSIQFITQSQVRGASDSKQPSVSRDADLTLEVLGYRLTEAKKKAFAAEALAALPQLMPAKPPSRIARVFGITQYKHPRIALQFHELSLATGDPFVEHAEERVAA